MTSTKRTGCWLSLRCRSTVADGRWVDTRCELIRWHVGPHHCGYDMNGLSWSDDV